MRNWRKGKGILVLFGTIVLFSATVNTRYVQAEDLQQQLIQYQQQVNQLDGQLTGQKQQEAAQTAKVLALRQSIQTLNDSITRYQTSLNDLQEKLKSLEAKKQDLENQRQQHIVQLGQFLRNNYEEGVTPYLEVLLQATSWTDFLSRLENVHSIINAYNRLQKEIVVLNQNIDSQQTEIKQSTDSLQATLAEKQQTQANLKQAMGSEQQVLAQFTAQEKTTLNARLSAQAKVNSVQRLIDQEKLEAALAAAGIKAGINPADSPKNGVSGPVTVSGGVQPILAYAQQYLGTPYVWGGTSAPPGFDCSGFVQHVFGHFGIALDRVSQDQFTEGVSVSRSDLKPGDLVFFSTYARGASHVGIYVGNNTMIDSSSYGVAYDDLGNSYWSARYLGARRVIAGN